MRIIKHNNRRVRDAGVSLIEILVVMGVITILVGLLSVITVKSIATGRQVTCANNLRQIGELFIAHMNESNGYFPPLYDGDVGEPWYRSLMDDSWPDNRTFTEEQLSEVRKRFELFRCPEDEHFIRDANWDTNDVPAGDGAESLAFVIAGDITNPLSLSPRANDSISYGLNYDVRDDDGVVWHADSAVAATDPDYVYIGTRGTGGGFEPDRYTMGQIAMKSRFIIAGDSDEDGVRDYAIAFNTDNERLGGRHDGKANVLFADGSVDLEPAGFRSTVEHDVNTWNYKRGLWTLPREPDYEKPFAEMRE